MATKKTEKTSEKKAPKAAAAAKPVPARGAARGSTAKKAEKAAAAPVAKKEKKVAAPVGPRHPKARVGATAQGSKEALAKALAPSLAMADEDTDMLEARLKTASNAQLLRLQRVTEQVKQKYGSREGLIEAIGKSANKGKDKDYLAKLGKLSLPNLLDLATTAERRARA